MVEVITAVTISAMITGVLGTAMYQFVNVTERGNDEFKTTHDMQNAGHWITLDAQRAQTTDLVDGAPDVNSVTLSWSDGGHSYSSSYSVSGTELQRNFNSTVTTVARHVSSIGFSLSGGIITVSLTSSPTGRQSISKDITYKIYMRPTS